MGHRTQAKANNAALKLSFEEWRVSVAALHALRRITGKADKKSTTATMRKAMADWKAVISLSKCLRSLMGRAHQKVEESSEAAVWTCFEVWLHYSLKLCSRRKAAKQTSQAFRLGIMSAAVGHWRTCSVRSLIAR